MNNVSLPVNRIYKDRLYKMIFNNKSELLKLYNAINGTHYNDPAMLTITTLDNAIYMTMENDLSFIIDMRLALYEQQSTVNPNLPLRFLMYITDIYSAYTKDMNIYGSKKVQIPLPSFVIFYNDVKSQPDRTEFLLSELFHPTTDQPALELKAVMLNINKGHNQELMNACHTLRDYSEYVARIRTYSAEMPLTDAVEKAITECIHKNILRDFLLENRVEAKAMSIYEYDEEKTLRMFREEGYEDGERNGKIQATIEMCLEFNLSSDAIVQKLMTKFQFSENQAQEYLDNYITQNS
ncbi:MULTISPECIES: hypothetical protein [unclassified Ruminococcus]|uniref:hypothetical protein n=1 Tax=unclassified Ruminococcus TaxID=2608920 RepID=UPI00189BF000|nr:MULTISPECIES: hypothetical protein [unclassified Ruminococcus]MDB8780950.1 hypothetical protein [Ruminococcus sp. 1001136sp1]MDB8788496.1 hypothetical protein [Ruminococcus sp. 1001136sp1]